MSDLSCAEFVEQVTDLLDDTLEASQRGPVLEHIRACEGCTRYLDQIRATIGILRNPPRANLPDRARDALRAAFRAGRHAE